MKLKHNVGRRIKEIRKKRGFSQEKLAELVDIEQNTLSCIETGTTSVQQKLLRR